MRTTHEFHSVILGNDVLAGFSGFLPLYVSGKKSPCAEVQLTMEMPKLMSKEDGNTAAST